MFELPKILAVAMNDTSYELFATGFTIHMFIVNTKHIRDFVVSILKVLSR